VQAVYGRWLSAARAGDAAQWPNGACLSMLEVRKRR